MNQVNEDLAFPHYLHIVDHTMVRLRHTNFWSRVKQIMNDNCRCQNWFFKETWRSPLQGLWTWVVNIITDTSDTLRDNVKPFSAVMPDTLFPVYFNLTYGCLEGQVGPMMIDDSQVRQLDSWAQHHHHQTCRNADKDLIHRCLMMIGLQCPT